MKKIRLLVASLLVGVSSIGLSQDLGVINIQTPTGDGCDLGLTTVQVEVRNFAATNYGPGIGQDYDVIYQLDGNAPVTQNAPNLLGFGAMTNQTFTFATQLNLNGNYGAHTLKVYTEVGGDVDNTNDTTTLTFTNFEPTAAGVLSESDTVCITSNLDTLILDGKIGDIVRWETNTGSGWQPLVLTDTFLIYTNLTQTTSYRVVVQNGTCNQETSNEVTVTVDPEPVAGTLAAGKTICQGDMGDTLRLSGYIGAITKWEMNTGSGWMDIANTDDTLIYGVLTQTTSYRVIVDTGVCNADTSNVVTITVVPVSVGGNIIASDTVCETANLDTLILTNSFGTVQRWEFTDDGTTWQPIITTDTFLIYTNLTQTRSYRVLVQNATCTPVYSDTATITVTAAANAGTLAQGQTVCNGFAGDTLRLTGYLGNIVKWQMNTGSGWMDIANTTDTLTYTNPTITTSYRVIVDTGVCDQDTSNVATITVTPATDGGNLSMNDSVCQDMNFGTITLSNHIGNVIEWQSSDDGGFTWVPIVNTDTFQMYNNLSNTRMYRVLVEATGCSQEFSDTVTITTFAAPVGGTIDRDKSICGGTNLDTLFLVGYSGMIAKWQYKDTAGWKDISNTTDTLIVSNLTLTTQYRAIVGNQYCPADTSSVATLTVIAVTVGGNIIQSDSVCLGINRDTLNLVGHIGDIRWWERSTDGGASWTPLANTTTSQIYNNVNTNTWYRVLVEATSCPNDYSDTAIIAVYEPVIEITPQDTTTFCEGDSVVLTATSGFVSYNWSTMETTESITAKTTDSYKVTVTDFRGCINSDSIAVTVNALPVADAGADVTISLGASTTLQGNGGVLYAWSPANTLNDSSIQNPIATPEETTIYSLVVTDNNGCIDEDSVQVTVLKDFEFDPKNLITPNGDGINDTWKVDNLIAYPECSVTILNRYGYVIYEATGYNNSWDGKSSGETVADGTYYYIITCEGSDIEQKGHITVLSK